VYARSTTIRGRPESVDDGIAFCRDEVLPMCRQMPGFVGLSLITDRESGRCIVTASWDSMESMRAVTNRVQPMRQRAAEILGGTPEVAEWEIAVMHRDHRAADGACARVTWLRGERAAMERAPDVFKLALMPEMETFDGFCGVSLLINREAGLAVTSVAFDSRAAMEGTREQARGLRARGSAEARLEITEVAEFELALAHLDVPELV
jgi:heme-degrading monooxygenase HmoA